MVGTEFLAYKAGALTLNYSPSPGSVGQVSVMLEAVDRGCFMHDVPYRSSHTAGKMECHYMR